jgi:sortase A
VLLVVAGLALWLTAYVFGFSALQEHHQQNVLYSQFREQLALGIVPPFGDHTTLKTGDPVALIDAPKIGLRRTIVVEGTSSSDLSNGPGHLPGTVLPGEIGVSTVMGRAAAFGAPFRRLTSVQAGATFSVTTGQGTFHYKVIDVRGPGDPIPASLASVSSRLTLVTAANAGWRNLWVPTHAVFVDAALQGKALPVATGTAPSAADSVMTGDMSALVPLVLWLQGLLLAALGLIWLRGRWDSRQIWAVGLPVTAALLWGVSTDLVRLLPNLF